MTYTAAEQGQHRTEWIAALRSGTYKMGRRHLLKFVYHESGDTYYDCLGVACDVAGLGRWEADEARLVTPRRVIDDAFDGFGIWQAHQYICEDQGSDYVLLPQVQAYYGLTAGAYYRDFTDHGYRKPLAWNSGFYASDPKDTFAVLADRMEEIERRGAWVGGTHAHANVT